MPQTEHARDEGNTRARILLAAEQLFADGGFDGTSLRQVALKAGVPVGLVSYHFDGKLGLYRAIFEVRTPVVVEQRKAGLSLAALEDDPARELELIVKAVLAPMLKLRTSEGSNHFGSLLARETNDPRSLGRGIVQELLDPVANIVVGRLRTLWPDRSEAEIHWAYQLMVGVMVFVMSDAGRISRLSGGAADPDDPDATLRVLVPLLLDGMRSGKRQKTLPNQGGET